MHSRKPKPYISRSPSMKLILRKNAKQPSFIASKKPKLESVSGITATNNSTFSYSIQEGLIAYPSGSVTVLYDFNANKHDYLVTSYKKTITSCSFSPDGKYFVTGECGLQPAIRVWDLKDKTELAQFYSHKYEVACVSFSRDMKYLVSIGSHHDMAVNVWDWKNKSKIGCNKISAKVKALSINEGSTFFVTVGVKHVKFWSLLPAAKSECYKNEPLPLTGRAAVLDSLLNETFNDVQCGYGVNNDSVYTVTQNGVLSLLSAPPARRLEISVNLQASVGNCLAVSEKAVICGGAQGRVCLYSASDLALISVLPPPSPLGGLSKSNFLSLKPNTQASSYADCMAACLDPHHKYAFCLYSDRSFYAWDLKDVFNIRLLQSQHFHSSCVWGILMAAIDMTSVSGQDQPFLPLIITCSSDDTVRFWVHESEDDQLAVSLDATQNFNNTSPLFQVQQHEGLRLKHVLYLDNSHAGLCQIYNSPAQSTLASKEKAEELNRQHLGIRAMALSKDGKLIALGDRIGNLRIYELEDFKLVVMIEAHDGEILSLDFSQHLPCDKQQQGGGSAYFLASGSRDRLIHVYDPRTGFTQCQTLQDHSSHVYSVRFSLALPTGQAAAPADNETTLVGDHRRCKTRASLLLISCAADQSLIIREAVPINGANANDCSGPGITFIVLHQISNIGFRLYDMDIDVFGRHVVTACQDRNIRVYDIVQGKQKYVCKGSLSEEGRLIKVVFDPSGTFVATSCRDKTVYIIDFGSGEVVASFSGHSEDVMDLKFSGDCRRLITATTEGSIFTWKLSTDLIKRMLSRLSQVTTTPNGPYLTHITSSQLSKGPFVSQDHRELPSKVQVRSNTVMPRSHDSQELSVVTTFQKDSNVDFNHPAGYKFSIGQLPSWAQKQVTALGNSKLPSFPEQEPSTKFNLPNSGDDVSRRLDVTTMQQSSLDATLDGFRTTVDNESPPSDMIYTAASTSNQKSKSYRWGQKTFNGTTAPKSGEEIYGATNLASSYSLIDISSSQLTNQPDARTLNGDFDDGTTTNIYESLSSKVSFYGQRGMAKSMADIRVAAPTTGPQIVAEFLPTDYDASSSDDKDSMSSSSVSQQHQQQQTNSSINTTLLPSIQKSPLKTLAVGEDEFSSDYTLNLPTTSLTTDPNRKSISHSFFHSLTFQSPDPALHSNPLKQTVQEMDAARRKMKNVLESLRFDSLQDQGDTPFTPIANTSKYRSMSKSISSFLSPSLDESSRLDSVSPYEGTPMRPQRSQHSPNFDNFTGGFKDITARRKSEHMENGGPKLSLPENRFSMNRGFLQKCPIGLERFRKNSATASASSPKASVTSSMSSLLSNACDNRPNNLKCSLNPYLPGSYASPTQNQGRKPLSYISCGGRRPTALGPNGHYYQNPTEGTRASTFGNRRSTTGLVTNLFSGLKINSPVCARDYPDSQDVGSGTGCGEWRSMTSLTIPLSSCTQGDKRYIGKQQKTLGDKNGFGASAQFYGNSMYASQHSLLGSTRRDATILSKSPSFRDLLKEATKIQGSREDLTAWFLGSNLPGSGSTTRPNLVKSLGIKNLVEYKYNSTNPFASHSPPEAVNHKEHSLASPLSPKAPQFNSRQYAQTTAPLPVKSVAINDAKGEETGAASLSLDTRTSPDGIVSSLPESKVYYQSSSKFFTTASGVQASKPQSDLVSYNKMDSFKAAYDQLKGSLRDLGKLVDCSQILRSVENSMSQMLDAYHKHEREGQQVCLHQHVQRLGADLLNSQALVIKHYDAVTKLLTQISAMNQASLCPSDQHPRCGSQPNDNPYLQAVHTLKSSLISHLKNLEPMTEEI